MPGTFFDTWLARRRPVLKEPFLLGRRRLYIVPTVDGLLFFLVLLLILIGAANYGSSLAFFLVFLLAGIAVNAIWLTHANLYGLTLETRALEPVFAGDKAVFQLLLTNALNLRRRYLLLCRQPGRNDGFRLAALQPGRQETMAIALPAKRRGWLLLPPLRLESTWPLGLFRVWTVFQGRARLLVYPSPAPPGKPFPIAAWLDSVEKSSRYASRGTGNEDFFGLRPYRPGDSPGRLDWRVRARGGELQTRIFAGGEGGGRLLFSWGQLAGASPEEALSQLCRWALEAESAGLEYGLSLPGSRLAPGRGRAHLDRVLTKLALFESHGNPG